MLKFTGGCSPIEPSENQSLSLLVGVLIETKGNPASLLSASKASRRVAGQSGLLVASVRRRLSAHSVAQALSCEGLYRKRCYVAECEIDASVMVTVRRLLHASPSMPKNMVPCREGRSLPRLLADCATETSLSWPAATAVAPNARPARCASRKFYLRAARCATCDATCMLRGQRLRARANWPCHSLPAQKRKFPP